uniref:Uncharacterized protein n=1 Tax=candidate division CPR3 bacterium TaxID=2268181 RepID=A0A7V3N519_UNCC3
MDKLVEMEIRVARTTDEIRQRVSLQMEKMGLPTFTSEELEAMAKSIHGAFRSLWWKKELVDALEDITVKRLVPPRHRLNALFEFLGFRKLY